MRRVDQNDWGWALFILPVVLGTLAYAVWRWKFVIRGQNSYAEVQT